MSAEAGRVRLSLGDIVVRLGGEVVGDAETAVSQVASLERAERCHITFFSNAKLLKQLQGTKAGAVIVGPADRDATALPRIVSTNPYAYFARVSMLLNPQAPVSPGIHSTAVVETSAQVSDSASIGPLAYIGHGARIGEGTRIDSGCHIGDGVEIGVDCRLYPNVTMNAGCVVGNRAIIHSGAVIGSDGFGFASQDGAWVKIPQIGRVLIGDDVEIGANTTVDRGAMDDTVIGNGVKLDNQIQIAHNVHVGDHTAMAGCVGVAGSARIGQHCTVGGGARILGHLELADDVQISAGTLITKSIRSSGQYTSGMPFSLHRDWLRNAAYLRKLEEMAEKIRRLEEKLNASERTQP
jgi:UDP-3-O-[3-hydroxymyristoyl] glucosamine N-acyltransferase